MGTEASKPGDRQTHPRDLALPVLPRTSTSSGSKRSGLQEAFDCRCIFFPASFFGLSLCEGPQLPIFSLCTPFLFPFLFQTSSCASGCGRSDQKGTAASTVLRGVHSINRPRTPPPTTKEPFVISSDKVCAKRVSNIPGTNVTVLARSHVLESELVERDVR